MTDHIKIVESVEADADILTRIAFAAKRHWNYPEEYIKIWQEELTITRDYIKSSTVYKAVLNDKIIGFYSIVQNSKDFYSGDVFVPKGYWLEHIFIDPKFHRRGIGRQLIRHALNFARDQGIDQLKIFVDPYAKGFYDKIGAEFNNFSKSSIPGRMIPVYSVNVN